jgi:hypothetical protein
MNTEMEKREIKESDHLEIGWYKEAKEQTPDSLPGFLSRLANDYVHDYGTICHALAAAAIGAANAMDSSEQGGITGFQAGCVMWAFIKEWMCPNNECGLRLIDYDNMLYPQYEEGFTQKTIKKGQWDIMRKQAAKLIEAKGNSKTASPEVLNHWISIMDGKVPFGYTVKD